MRYIAETIFLGVTSFVLFVLTTVYYLVATTIVPVFHTLYNNSGIGGKANSILDFIVICGYAACLVFFVGAIILYLVKSHEEEHESTYRESQYESSNGGEYLR